VGTLLNSPGTGGYYGAYIFILSRTIAGMIIVGSLTFPSFASRHSAGPRPIRQEFEFRGVSFTYSGSERLIIQDINFRMEPQEKVALIGENGAGETIGISSRITCDMRC
jgi:ATP-binding cassette subfamily B protein